MHEVLVRHSAPLLILSQAIHARSGVPYEIMGIMQGKVVGKALVVVDSFALPVQGTETRVNAANEANEFMVQYVQGSERVRLPSFPPFLLSVQSPNAHPPRRFNGWRTRSAGTTRTRATAAGCPEST